MKITYLGHAGFCVETTNTLIIMDPWLSTHGAFDAAWFQYPPNHHLSGPLQTLLNTSHKEKYLYISHEHQDHFDIDFLQSLQNRDFTLILANYTYPVILNSLKKINYQCKNIVILDHAERFKFSDGELVLFIIDTELTCDSAILVTSGIHTFLNLNDCNFHDHLQTIVDNYGKITVFTAQFSGASWYPTSYVLSQKNYQLACEQKIETKFKKIAAAIEVLKPDVYLPSAGPPCFLDPLLIEIHSQKINSYPTYEQLFIYLNSISMLKDQKTRYLDYLPGDVLDVETLTLQHAATVNPSIQDYANTYQTFFANRQRANALIDPEETFQRLKSALLEKVNALTSIEVFNNTKLYWQLSDFPAKMYCIDLQKKTLIITEKLLDNMNYYRISTPAWQINKVLMGEISWPEFALTLRMKLERVPDCYNTIIHGFLLLEPFKITSFCKKMSNIHNSSERVILQCNGKKYSIKRYCPHQGADLAHAKIEGNSVVCPRHQWKYNLEDHGQCTTHPVSIEAIELESDMLE